MPFAVDARDGILTLTLDTPRSAVNIFNHATATQLVDILATVDPRTTRAIVFETAKPGSFLNGVGLLLAHAAQTPESLAAAAGPPWAAYRAVREAPIPTIAVIQGNCFGCGVEFALQCDYRLASDRVETVFYMTELNDYRFLPLFGSTWNLPATIGMADAIDLLLWGERWDARTAHARGLVDAVAPDDTLADHRDRFIADVLAGKRAPRERQPAPDPTAVIAAARARIAALPPMYAPVYGAGLDLLIRGARQTDPHEVHQACELAASTTSALSPIGKAAFAFFYIRQRVAQRAVADQSDPTTVETASETACKAPLYVHGRLAEITAPRDHPGATQLARALQRYGWDVARTTPESGFVTPALVSAYLTPLVATVTSPHDVVRVNATLRAAGYVRRPHDVLGAATTGDFAPLVATATGLPIDVVGSRFAWLTATTDWNASADDRLDAWLSLELLAFVLATREANAADVPTIDVIAREAIDFPLHHTSLCRWLTRSRVQGILERFGDEATAIPATTIRAARAFVLEGRDFYR